MAACAPAGCTRARCCRGTRLAACCGRARPRGIRRRACATMSPGGSLCPLPRAPPPPSADPSAQLGLLDPLRRGALDQPAASGVAVSGRIGVDLVADQSLELRLALERLL